MRNQTQTAQPATATRNRERLTVAFQNFNDVFLAKISNLKGKETYAFGATTAIAQQNAMRNYRLKYFNI